MFMLNNAGAVATATVPDVCNTATPAGPVPVPYPNIAETTLADPSSVVSKVLVSGMPALNLMSKVTLSNGDQVGAQGGVTSARIMGQMAFLSGSTVVMVDGKPAVRLTSQTSHNGQPQNTVGMVCTPSQTIVMVAQ